MPLAVGSAPVGEILGPDLLVVLVIIALLFGSSRLPKLARSLGHAKSEFERGLRSVDVGPDSPGADEVVTMTRAELDALLAEREARARCTGPDPGD